jgi:hypothetical protein
VAVVGSCSSSIATTHVTVNPTPGVISGGYNGPICEGEILNLTASFVPTAQYQWYGPNGYTSRAQNPQVSAASIRESGTYSVVAWIGNCSSQMSVVNVVVLPAPPILTAGSSSPVCEGQTLSLFATPIPGAQYFWKGPDGFSSNEQAPILPGMNGAKAGAYEVSVKLGACSGRPVTTSVVVNPTPSALTASSNGAICAGGRIELFASPIPGATYVWTGPGGYSSNQQNPVITNAGTAQSGVYSVTAYLGACASPVVPAVVTVQNCSDICPIPGNLVVDRVSGNTASLRWDAVQQGLCYVVELSEKGTNNWQSQLVPAPATSLQLQGLLPGVEYSVQVRANCSVCAIHSGNRSNFSAPYHFMTTPAKNANKEGGLQSIALYPNPSQGMVVLKLNLTETSDALVEIKDIRGSVVYSRQQQAFEGENEISLNLSHLSKGLYIVGVRSAGALQSVKLMLE